MIILPINAILQGQSYTRPQVDAALALKQNVLTFDDTPTANSNNPVKSGGIKTELDGKLPIAENQEQAPVGYVLTKTSTGSQWQRASSEGGTIAAAANSYPVTLLAANWSDHTYVIATPTGATITADCDGILGLAPNASAAQVEAFQLAKIVVTSQSTTGVTVVARGQVPTINLSLELTLFMKADYYTKTEEDALLATKAPLGSPAFTGTPTAPTPASGDNDTSIATTAFVQGEVQKIPNPNLLRNWYFVGGGSQQGQGEFPINPTGKTSYVYSSNGATIRQWLTRNSGNTVTLYNDGITLVPGSGNTDIDFYQALSTEECTALLNEQITISLLWENDILDTFTSTWTSGTSFHEFTNYTVIYGSSTRSFVNFCIRYTGTSPKLKAVKLEVGSQQTLCRNIGTVASPVWVLNEIPDYDLEWARCMNTLGLFPFGLPADLVLHVNATNGDDTNDGLTAATALKTINAAFAKIPSDTGGRKVVISLAKGTYAAATLGDRYGGTYYINNENNADSSSTFVQGLSISSSCAGTSVFLSYVTFTGNVTTDYHVLGGFLRVASCIFDGARLIMRGGQNYCNNNTFRNIANSAIYGWESNVFITSGTIENTVTTGVNTQGGVVTVETITNSATSQYATSQGGRIFVGPRTYQEAPQRVLLNGSTFTSPIDITGASGSNRIHIPLSEDYRTYQFIGIEFGASSTSSTRGSILIPPGEIAAGRANWYPVCLSDSSGVRLSNTSGSYTSFDVIGVFNPAGGFCILNVYGYPM